MEQITEGDIREHQKKCEPCSALQPKYRVVYGAGHDACYWCGVGNGYDGQGWSADERDALKFDSQKEAVTSCPEFRTKQKIDIVEVDDEELQVTAKDMIDARTAALIGNLPTLTQGAYARLAIGCLDQAGLSVPQQDTIARMVAEMMKP